MPAASKTSGDATQQAENNPQQKVRRSPSKTIARRESRRIHDGLVEEEDGTTRVLSFYEVALASPTGSPKHSDCQAPEVVPGSVRMINRRSSKSRASFGLPPGTVLITDMEEKAASQAPPDAPHFMTIEDLVEAIRLATKESRKQLASEEDLYPNGIVETPTHIEGDYSEHSRQRSPTSTNPTESLMQFMNISDDDIRRAELRRSSPGPIRPPGKLSKRPSALNRRSGSRLIKRAHHSSDDVRSGKMPRPKSESNIRTRGAHQSTDGALAAADSTSCLPMFEPRSAVPPRTAERNKRNSFARAASMTQLPSSETILIGLQSEPLPDRSKALDELQDDRESEGAPKQKRSPSVVQSVFKDVDEPPDSPEMITRPSEKPLISPKLAPIKVRRSTQETATTEPTSTPPSSQPKQVPKSHGCCILQ